MLALNAVAPHYLILCHCEDLDATKTQTILPTHSQQIETFRQRVNKDRINALLSRVRNRCVKRKISYYLNQEAAVAA